MNPETNDPYYDPDPVDYDAPQRQMLWATALLLFLIHAIPPVGVALKGLTIPPDMMSPLEASIILTLSCEAILSVIGFIAFVRKRHRGWILTGFVVAARIAYILLCLLLLGAYMNPISFLVLLFSILTLVVLMRPKLRELFGVSAPASWITLSAGGGSMTVVFLVLYYWLNSGGGRY